MSKQLINGRLVDVAQAKPEKAGAAPVPGVFTSGLELSKKEGRGRRWLAFHAASGLWIVADANRVERTFADRDAAATYRKRAVVRSRTR